MQNARVLARIMGPVMIVSAAGLFLNLHTYQRMVDEFAKSPSLCYLGGFMALIMGLVILQFHHTWELRWPVIITVFGWLATVKGAALMLFPAQVLGMWHPFMGTPVPLIVAALVYLVVGVFLSMKGYGKTQ
jgi:hypothetical protein